MDDLQNLPEPSRSRAKALLTCTLCTQYFTDPRVLPCRHSFCRKCLQAVYDKLVASAVSTSRRIGAMPCPSCAQPIGIPTAGMRGFPVDTKISRIKDLVVNEMAQNISKKINGDGFSDTASTNSGYSSKSADYNSTRNRRDHSYDNMAPRSDAEEEISGYKRNPTYPDFAKFSRFFDHEGKPVEPMEYKPTIRPDRHRVGYSNSFQHRQRRRVVVRTRAFDDTGDLFEPQPRYGSAPHVNRDGKEGANPYVQSNEDLSSYQRSRSARPASNRRYHSPVSIFDEEDDTVDYDGSSSKPANGKENEKADSNVPLPNLRRTSATFDLNTSGTSRHEERPSEFRDNAQGYEASSESSRRSSRLTTENIRPGRERINRDKRPSSTLPVHRENIETNESTSPSESSFQRSRGEESAGTGRRLPRTPTKEYETRNADEYESRAKFQSGNESSSSQRENSSLPNFDESTKPIYVPKSRMNFERAAPEYRSSYTTTRRPDVNVYEDVAEEMPTHEMPKRPHTSNDDSRERRSGHEPASRSPAPMTFEVINNSQDEDNRQTFETPKQPIFETPRRPPHVNVDEPKSRRSTTRRSDVHVRQNEENMEEETGSSYTTTTRGDTRNHESNRRTKSKKEYTEQDNSGDKAFNFSTPQTEDGGAQSEEGGPTKRSRRRRVTKPSWKHDKDPGDERRSNFVTPEDQFTSHRDYRTKDQIRTDARRSYSARVHETMKKHYSEQNAASTAEGDSVQLPDVGAATPLITCETTERSTSSDRCNAGEPDSRQRRKSTIADESDTKNVDDTKPTKKVEPEPWLGRNWDDLLRGAREKYSSERIVAPEPDKKEPSCAEGVYSRWRLEKAEYGIPTSMAITSKGCVIVAEYGQSCLEFYDDGGALTHKMEGCKPFSVVVNDKDQVIVGDRKAHAVCIFDEYGCDVARWDATTFNWICGIGILPNGQLAIYDRERCKLGIYSSPGELVREFASFGVGESQLCMADFLTVDSKGRVLIADSGNHCVKAFDANTGAFVAKFGARGVNDGCLDWPKGICVDENDNVIVTDVYNNRVSMFTPDGQFMRHLITNVESPYSVCYNKEMNAIGVTAYSLDGASQYDIYAI